ncbi:unnamed protein product [Effrenium voratum]|nr:unnamed protein product [Effrenium voratum]
MAVLSTARPTRTRTYVDFLFGKPLQLVEVASICEGDVEEEKESPETLSRLDGVLEGVGAFYPAAVAAHAGLLSGGGVAMACLPIAVPFSVPQVSSDSWLANKRARAFHRGVVITVYTQGILTLLKLSRGDLVGGLYDGVLCAMGTYAIQPEGQRFFPTYIICCGFNGLLALLQILQGYQGVPVHFLPLLAIVPPSIALFGAYCGWQFCKEVNAIAAGHVGAGPQDTCFVRVMGADWWPSFLGPQVAQREETNTNWGRPSGAAPAGGWSRDRFSVFAGDGHRLGETQ